MVLVMVMVKITNTNTNTNTKMKYVRILFPFLITLLLWRLAIPFWNPGGVLAIIPIFYFSFIRPVHWFGPFAALFCFLIDYNFDTLLFWTALYCLFYAMNGFQTFVDLTRQKQDGLLVFIAYFGAAALILSLFGFTFAGMLRAVWLTCWLGVLYIPFVQIAKRVGDNP